VEKHLDPRPPQPLPLQLIADHLERDGGARLGCRKGCAYAR
jgi:hypothetical protein